MLHLQSRGKHSCAYTDTRVKRCRPCATNGEGRKASAGLGLAEGAEGERHYSVRAALCCHAEVVTTHLNKCPFCTYGDSAFFLSLLRRPPSTEKGYTSSCLSTPVPDTVDARVRPAESTIEMPRRQNRGEECTARLSKFRRSSISKRTEPL